MKTSCHHLIPRLAALALGALSLVILPRVAPAQAVLTKLGDFDGDNGENPDYGVIFGADGNLYGVTTNGGSTTDSQGCVFRCSPTGGSLTRVAEFTSAATGFHPMGGLLLAKDGNFYGTTNGGDGDQHSDGTIFRLAPAGTLTTIYVFRYYADDMMYDFGREPAGALIQGSDGLLYGQCTLGGLQGMNDPQGTLFKFNPGTSLLQSHSLNGGVLDAAGPHTRMVEVMPGVFYGASLMGGEKDDGTIYRFTSDLEEKVEYHFDTDGPNPAARPASGLTIGSDGKLYGTTEGSGTENLGVYYRYNPNGGYEELGSFTGTANGSQPVGEMVLATDGNLYGVTSAGGSNDYGTIFRLTTAGVLTTVFDFAGPGSDVNGINYGFEPEGALVQGADGRLYGTAHGGGVNSLGTVLALSLNPVITSAPSLTGHQGSAGFSYRITGTNTPTTYAASGLPPGTKLNTATGLISGTPTTVGRYSVKVSATNGMGTGSATVAIVIEGPAGNLAFSAASYAVNETAGSLTVKVARAGGSSGAVSVVCETLAGTAKSGTDYTGLSQTLNWANGDTASKSFTVALKDVGVTDGSTRQFSLKLLSPTGGAALGINSTAPVTITENDPVQGELEFASSSYSVNEDAGTVTVHVNRTVGTTGAVSVVCGTQSSTAKSGTDYTGKSQTISWADGDKAQKSFTVTIKNRGASGGNGLKFSVVLSSPADGAILGTPATASVTIN